MRRARQLTLSAPAIGLLALTLLLPRPAAAGDKDADALLASAEAMSQFLEGKTPDALKKIDDWLKQCAGSACEPGTRAQLYLAAAIIHGAGEKDLERARAYFEGALLEDPKATPDKQFMTKDLDKAFQAAKANLKAGTAARPGARPPPSKDQVDAVAAAEQQLSQKAWSDCMATAIAAMTASEFAAGKLILARCEDAGDLLIEARADARAAAKLAEEEQNADVGKRAAELLSRLETDTPKLQIVVPKAIYKPEVKVDGVVIPPDKADKPIQHNPGKATIEVTGKRGSYPFKFKTTETVDRGENVTVNVQAQDASGDSAVLQCILAAKSAADVNLCIETGGRGRGLTFKGGAEISTYVDTDNTDVITPMISVSAENPTAGFRVGGSFLVDVVTTASADIVASASRRLDEVRYAGTLAGEYKIDFVRVGVDGAISVEDDYVGRGVGASVAADLFDKTVTPSLAYGIGFDILGRSDTPFDVFSRDLTRHSIDGGLSLILDPSTVLAFAGTLELDFGDSSKPYRHIPLFTRDVAERIPRGASRDLVGRVRVPPAPLEQLPEDRIRGAVLGRAIHRFETVTIRGDERLYLDSWGLKASTTDGRIFADITDPFRVGGHLRFHIQGPVDFWQRAYVATPSSAGYEIPEYRAGDRELGPLFAVTLGGGARYALTESLAAALQVEGIYTQYLDHLYIYDRLGIFTATTLELEVE